MKLLICDDDVNDLKKAEQISQRWCDKNEVQADISIFSNADEMIAFLSKHGAADIYILDVLMPSVGGIELGRLIRNMDRNGKILYLTSTRDYAVDSYEADAFYYLIKPISEVFLHFILHCMPQIFRL